MENKELNLVEILKDCPEGTELYTTMFGKVLFVYIDKADKYFPIHVELQDGGTRALTSEGKYSTWLDSECVLFPSKENRDWLTFNPQKKEYKFKPFDKVLVRDSASE